jgi:RNase P subunit RPR2
MQMNNKIAKKEREHIEKVKSLPCSVCNAPQPSSAHHIRQDCQYTVVALCHSCHQDPHNGIHGEKRMWWVMNMDEMQALNITIARLVS